MKLKTLPSERRDLLGLVAEAAFSCPFSPDRDRLDRQIAGVGDSFPDRQLLSRVTGRVRQQLDALGPRDRLRPTDFGAEDARLLRTALLFDLFHRAADDLDRHIRRQLDSGEEPIPVPFAADLLGTMRSWGCGGNESLRYLAFFYQLRRAFYFIAEGLVGCSPCMVELRRRLWHNVFTADITRFESFLWDRMEDFSTLLLGETGCGKGAAAAAIGRSGHIPFDERRGCFRESFTRTFLGINLSQYPSTLIESELFGHRRGAFTGAVDQYQGVFSRCSPHGAIFLDEIGDVEIPVQIKLLQVLQEREFCPVGSHQRQRFSGRVIAATNRSLEELRDSGAFRDDFYYRLCSDVIQVPSLRQRLSEDGRELQLLLGVVVKRSVGEDAPELVAWLGAELRRQLPGDYAWPGNVRELEQAVRRLLLNGSYAGEAVRPAAAEGFGRRVEQGRMAVAELLAGYCGLLYRRHGTYEEVARITGLDRRTVKKYVLADQDGQGSAGF
ncbi:sigma-54-dependent transcriptional regulator [Geothermobacter hydrogeniphilus]|uniref:Fis family transcriptional regulator n=1 Tax=Geothermobacter hydrogeniphilus TaxID=1969733 RepID=A0A1X0Y0R7_9BACT|nr:sigma 54-interacting transcriptional regulator [Geothermobacter hydrogeniphilus]ORJ58697.1 Fis family transcriptional regulator [Geothermobacter hydrogeniphilus]